MASLVKRYEVKLTYNDGRDRDLLTLTTDDNVDERALVASCFGAADEAKALAEISGRLVGAIRKGKKLTRAEHAELRPPECLAKRSGRFRFSADASADADTQYWSAFRDEYVQQWQERFGKKKAGAKEWIAFKEQFIEQQIAKDKRNQ